MYKCGDKCADFKCEGMQMIDLQISDVQMKKNVFSASIVRMIVGTSKPLHTNPSRKTCAIKGDQLT
jgi:hypothetical protein